MNQQLQHDPVPLGGPCRRCGVKYTVKTAYIPCFVEDDTYGSWLARLPAEARERAAPALTARTRSGFYDWAKDVRSHGATEEEISVFISKSIREMRTLLEGKCPKCGAPLARYANPQWQQGSSEVCGMWVMYRCSTQPPPGERRDDDGCDFMLDLKEVVTG